MADIQEQVCFVRSFNFGLRLCLLPELVPRLLQIGAY